jgi:Effector-associated domain 1
MAPWSPGARRGGGMDAERAHALSLKQLGGFHKALVDAYVGRNQLQQLLSYELERPNALPESDSLDDCVFNLIRLARSEDWLHELINAVLADRPRNAKLQEWSRNARKPSAHAQLPPAQRLLDSKYFDLEAVRTKVANTSRNATPGEVIAFGIPNGETVFIQKFTGWLGSFLGDTQLKEPLTLRPDFTSVTSRLRHVSRYRQDLETANVLCVVYVDGIKSAIITEFWHGVRTALAGTACSLVLVFAGELADGAFPAGITELPPPRFEIGDIEVWAHLVADLHGWPPKLARAWTVRLHREAWTGEILDVRLLYEAMDQTIEDARFDEARFLRQLEEGADSAYTTPA